MNLFYLVPEWVCLILTLVFVYLSYELGFRIGTRRRLKPGENPETAAGVISGITVGLLAFILAFTFNGAATNHDLRKDLLIEEANTVRTAYQRSMQIPDPYRAEVHDLLQEYLDIRLKMRGLRMAELKPLMERAKGIQAELWSAALEVQKKEPNTPMIELFTESLNQLFDAGVKRICAVAMGRISSIIWVVLYLLTFITMAMVGYRIGLKGVRSTFMEVSLTLAFSLVLIVIVALDRPNGVMRIDQRPMANVLNMLRTSGVSEK